LARFKRVTTTGSHFTVFLEEERLLDEEVFLRGLEEEEEEEEEEDAPTSPAQVIFQRLDPLLKKDISIILSISRTAAGGS
jgi:tetrahydromethanopterin S-methyltransferase subunit A